MPEEGSVLSVAGYPGEMKDDGFPLVNMYSIKETF